MNFLSESQSQAFSKFSDHLVNTLLEKLKHDYAKALRWEAITFYNIVLKATNKYNWSRYSEVVILKHGFSLFSNFYFEFEKC